MNKDPATEIRKQVVALTKTIDALRDALRQPVYVVFDHYGELKMVTRCFVTATMLEKECDGSVVEMELK